MKITFVEQRPRQTKTTTRKLKWDVLNAYSNGSVHNRQSQSNLPAKRQSDIEILYTPQEAKPVNWSGA